MKKSWKIAAAAALLALVCWCGWYSRPVSIFDLKPELEPADINIHIQRFDDSAQGYERRSLDVDADSPEGQALLEQVESIRIRRSPLNPLRNILASSFTGRQVQTGQYTYGVHVFGTGGGWVSLEFFLDEWKYDLPEQAQYLPCRVSDGKALGQALGDELWEIAQQIESNP